MSCAAMSYTHLYFKKNPPALKAAYVVTCFIIITTTGVAYSQAEWIKLKSECEVWKCPSVWLAQVGLIFVVLPGMFAIAMLIRSLVPDLKNNAIINKVDYFGHYGATSSSIAAFVSLTTYVILALIYFPCDVHPAGNNCLLFRNHKGEIFAPITMFMGAGVVFDSLEHVVTLGKIGLMGKVICNLWANFFVASLHQFFFHLPGLNATQVLSLFNAIFALYVSKLAKKALKPPKTPRATTRMVSSSGRQSNSYSVAHV